MRKGVAVRVALALAAVLLAGCGEGGGPTLVEQRLLAMGTWVDVEVEAPDEARGLAALAKIEALFREVERDYYPWTDGELARINAAIGASRTIDVTPPMARLLARARELAEVTDGCYDAGIGGLVELWGFGPERTDRAPSDAAIETWRASGASILALDIDGNTVSSRAPSVVIDLGGIAKGWAVDSAMAALATAGIENALVNAGGDLSVAGRRGERRWRIGIQAPRVDGLLGVVELEDGESAFTSGDYERYYDDHGKRRHHILDPKTGYPVTHTQAVTVIASNGTEADAAATALFVAGPTRWRELAQRLGIGMVLRVDASGAIETTAAMRDRFQATDSAGSDIIPAGP